MYSLDEVKKADPQIADAIVAEQELSYTIFHLAVIYVAYRK